MLLEVLEKFDQEKCKAIQASAAETISMGMDFKASYAKAAADLDLGKEVLEKEVEYKPWAGMDQVEAKQYVPPTTSVSRGVVREEWCGHCEPNPRLCERFVDHGGDSMLALEVLLQQLWKQFLFKYGLSEKSCTVKGLFK